MNLQKAKEEYYEKPHFSTKSYIGSGIKYIKALEESNAEMLEALKKIDKENLTHLKYYVRKIIEKNTGKPIEKVIK